MRVKNYIKEVVFIVFGFLLAFIFFKREPKVIEKPVVVHDTTVVIKVDTLTKWKEKIIYKPSEPEIIYVDTGRVDTFYRSGHGIASIEQKKGVMTVKAFAQDTGLVYKFRNYNQNFRVVMTPKGVILYKDRWELHPFVAVGISNKLSLEFYFGLGVPSGYLFGTNVSFNRYSIFFGRRF
jgi:hypothetical protein